MGKPATLRVDILADSKQASAELDGFSSKVAGFTAGVTSALSGFALDKFTEAATASARFLVSSIESAGSLSSALSTLNVNYGQSASIIEQWARSAAQTVGLSTRAAVEATNRFAGYAKAIGLTGLEAGKWSTSVVQLAADLAAFRDLPVAQALDAIASAFRGERDPIEAFITGLNDVEVKAALFRATGEKVTGTLTTQQNILGTVAALTEQAADATGTFAREAKQLGTAKQILTAQLENLSDRIGAVFLPKVTELIDKFSGPLLTAAEDVVKAFEEDGLSGAIRKLAEQWDASAPVALKAFDDLVTKVSNGIIENVPNFIEWTRRASQWIVDAIVGDGSDANPGLVVRIAQFVQGLNKAIGDNNDQIRSAGAAMGSQLASGLFDALKTIIEDQVKQFFTTDYWVNLLLSPIGPYGVAVQIYDYGRKIGEWLYNGIKDFLTEFLPNALKSSIQTALQGIGGFLGGAAGAVFDFFNPTNSTSGNRSQAMTINYYTTVNADIPPGINGWDAGANIANALNDYYARTGYTAP